MSFDRRPRKEDKMVLFALANARGKTPKALGQALAEKFKVVVEFALMDGVVFFKARSARKIYDPIPIARSSLLEEPVAG